MEVILRNSNNTQALLTEAMLRKIPALYSQDGKGDEAIAYLKLFAGGWTWFVCEINPETLEAFGKVYSDMEPHGGYGYIDLREVASAKIPLGIGKVWYGVERDRFFKPCRIGDCKNPCQA